MRDIISALDFSRDDFLNLFSLTDEILKGKRVEIRDRVVANAFFEPSTRTALSFATAAQKLGAKVIGFSGTEAISEAKGENFADTIRMLENYSDCIVIRHKFDGAAKFAAEISTKPIINAGDGKHEHPTQTLIDLYTVYKIFGEVDNLTFGLLGDLKYARTINSLLRGLTRFRPKIVYLISPQTLRARKEILKDVNYEIKELDNPYDVISEIDVLYVTRIQKERFPDEIEYQKVKESYKVDENLVNQMKKEAIILHPLPRVNEIDRKIDKKPQAKYFYQASLGVPVRMALLYSLLGDQK